MKKNFSLIFLIISIFLLFIFLSFWHYNPKVFAKNILNKADIEIDGNRPWDIKVHNDNLYPLVIQTGSLGLGESYMNGWWDCQHLDQFFYKILKSEPDKNMHLNWTTLCNIIKSRLMNLQSKERAFEIGQHHYDMDNNFFQKMLDKNMVYSCGYWQDAKNLDEAQEKKLDLICRKLKLQKGMHILDIGCGWGGLAIHAAKNYGVKVTGITVSKEQAKFAQEHSKNLPIIIEIKDYRDLKGNFDRIVSVGMFEHVGYKNYKEFMKIVNSCLKDDGLFLLHTIGGNQTVYAGDPWLTKYIFPNGMLPSPSQIIDASQDLFIIEDCHNFGADYDKTLMAWFNNFNNNWGNLKQDYDEKFYRMWKYYLLSCAGLFRARKAQLWQIVFSKHGIDGGYRSVR